jgi:hypothetical protein
MERAALLRRFRIDRRLLALGGVAALLIVGELSLRAVELHQQLESELRKVRGRADVLAAGSDQMDWAARTRAADDERDELQARLWQTPSEAQAQARLRDWLASALQSAAVARPTVSLLPPQAAPAASSASASARSALRVRATVNFDLAPNALESALVQIEAGGQLARVDSLSGSARNRRVEMTVSVPVLLRPEVAQ